MKKCLFMLPMVLFALSFVAYADLGEVENKEAAKGDIAVPASDKDAGDLKIEEEGGKAVLPEAAAENPAEEVKAEEKTTEEPKAEDSKAELPAATETSKAEEVKPAEAAAAVEAPKKEETAVKPEEKKAEEQPEKQGCGCVISKVGMAILYYLPNRILDLNDSISMDIGVGSEAGIECGVTKYCQFGGMYGDKYFLMKGYKNQYGGAYSGGWNGELLSPGWNYGFICLSDEGRVVDDNFGTVKKIIKKKSGLGLASREEEVYKRRIRDFWEVNLEGGWLVTFGLQFHPVDFADFLCGILFIDFKGNDLK